MSSISTYNNIGIVELILTRFGIEIQMYLKIKHKQTPGPGFLLVQREENSIEDHYWPWSLKFGIYINKNLSIKVVTVKTSLLT